MFLTPILGLLAIGVALLIRRDGSTASRLVGLAAFALMFGYVVVFLVWWSRACWDVGTPPGCETAQPLLLGTWIAGVACLLAAIVLVLVGWLRRRARPHDSVPPR
jgi:membrane protein implicated in regulation of membrane protease activity